MSNGIIISSQGQGDAMDGSSFEPGSDKLSCEDFISGDAKDFQVPRLHQNIPSFITFNLLARALKKISSEIQVLY